VKLGPERLAGQLKAALAPVYLVAGDEPLQREECADAIRKAARERGYTDRQVFVAERGFEWQTLLTAGASLSLFASQRILELRLPTGKPGAQGAEALAAYAQNPAPDTLLLVISHERPERNARWAEALERAGVAITVWPLEGQALGAWVRARLKSRGLEPSADAVTLIADRVEGNLLAAAQEVDKLVLLTPAGPLDAEAVAEAVADSARYDAFKLVDAALVGDLPRTVRILEGLQAEGEEPVMVLGALTRQLKELAGLAAEIEGGQAAPRVLAGIWERRRPLVQMALRRRRARGWQRLLKRAQRADAVLKGQASGRSWDVLLDLSTAFAATPVAAGR
jgi:DNA polymerase-3 subunit delta